MSILVTKFLGASLQTFLRLSIDMVKLPTIKIVPVYVPTSSEWDYQFPQTLAKNS